MIVILTFELPNPCSINIVFDENLTLELGEITNLNIILKRIAWAFQNYPFKTADVIDADTGKILLKISDI